MVKSTVGTEDLVMNCVEIAKRPGEKDQAAQPFGLSKEVTGCIMCHGDCSVPSVCSVDSVVCSCCL